MLPTALRVLARTAFLFSAAAVASVSCSRQGEGDRCDYAWAGPDQDCQSDLICTPCGNLQEGIVDRCCRRDGTVTDPRCTAAASPTNLTCNTHGDNLNPVANTAGATGDETTETGTGGTSGTSSTGGSSSPGGNAGQPGGGSTGEPDGG
ncbi:MAG TPA: hypothetical protein VMI54_04050 [Polyangiaceae bacterium]|nr:hypothetical protein [Polyangiaceae bacterium]